MMISIVIGRPMKKTMMRCQKTVEDILFCISFWTNVDLLPTRINCPNPRKQSGKQNGVSEFASTIQCKRSQMLRLAIRDSSSTASKM